MTSAPNTEKYQVIARKYRPQTFVDVMGQEAIVTTLKNALRFNRIAHAYLFCGCRGTGKTTLARVFSKALNCRNLTNDYEPCNSCQSCLEVSQGRSLDVIEIDGASHRGIDDIRQINETIGYAPSSGKYKIYIIDEVHMLTKEAFNALLKTLEEPPPNVKFFFATTEPHKVLQTIMSRCQRFDLSRITLSLIQEKLEKIGKDLNLEYEHEALELIAKLSDGSLRDAESLFDQVICYNEGKLTTEKITTSLGLVSSSTFFELDQAVEEQDLSYAFILAEKIFSSGKDLSYFLDSLMEHFRTILSLQLGQPHLLPPLQAKKYQLAATVIYTQENTLYILDYLLEWLQQIAKSTFKRISIEMILLHIIRSKKRISIDTLVKRLHQLQKELPPPFPIYNTGSADPIIGSTLSTSTQSQTVLQDLKIAQPIPEQVHKTSSTANLDTITSFTNHEIKSKAASLKSEEPKQSAPTETPKPTELSQPTLDIAIKQTKAPSPQENIEKTKPTTSITEEKVKMLSKPKVKHETVIRFAAVELDGVFSKK